MPAVPLSQVAVQLRPEDNIAVAARDLAPGMEHSPGNNNTISLSGDDSDALRGYWEKLADGGQVMMPLEKQAWGDEFGMCTDRFGIPWMVDIGQQQS